ncbi:MAG TPA: citrate lyase acyl carrier protein [Sporomusaceae bacterium]|jgi:citrate lyase subunit gamma (acyl carrier protein)|uniref:citrate lyase acyl carrier protein n=1 Tax=Anaerospora sp. TaxID=1960278 RepID=UPI000EE5BD75|nr:citrate lyase acyl carrier protein [Anaerospora sp.]MDF2929716.1 citrate lyase acyl carrier protein [Anaerospora sp.]HAK74508.1 citrate lyase acyl carrier protein [Sporomusaceae bacterium]
MGKLLQPGQAGTLESNDIVVTVAPATAEDGIVIELTSPVIKQYGKRIREVIAEALADAGVQQAFVQANDKGALDCTIRARVQTAVARALQEGGN